MRLILRLVGTWLLGVALILLIIDGTKSLAANTLIFTSFGESWTFVHAASLVEVRNFLTSRLFGPLLELVVNTLLALPGWLILAVPGLLLAWLGRSKRSRMFVRQDQI
jgi:hypothetical protein